MHVMKPACCGDKNHHEHKLHFIREKLHTSLIIIENAREAQNAIFNSFYVHDDYHKRIKIKSDLCTGASERGNK
jgi:hypothetical protein